MKRLLIGFSFIGIAHLAQANHQGSNDYHFALVDNLPTLNQDYIQKVSECPEPVVVSYLQQTVANYDLLSSKYYVSGPFNYSIDFKNTQGIISATFDQYGKIQHTYERYTNISVPLEVSDRIMEDFPNFKIMANSYLVTYTKGKIKAHFKLKIQKDDQVKRIQLDREGRYV